MSTATCERTAVLTVARRMVRLLNEVVAGARPARQVSPLFRAHLRGALQRNRPTSRAVARILRLAVTSHRDGVYEVVAVCADAGRVSALGLQLTRTCDGAWVVSDVAHPQLDTPGPLLSDPTIHRTAG